MELQTELPSPAIDFNFNGGRSSPGLSSPSTPRGFGAGAQLFNYSAPTSPAARVAKSHRDLEDFSMISAYPAAAAPWWGSPSRWHETSEFPNGAAEADDFAFDVIPGENTSSLSAEELFDGGKVRPLKHCGGEKQQPEAASLRSPLLPPASPRSSQSQGKKRFWSSFLPKKRREKTLKTEQPRGRERVPNLSASTSGRRGARSLSPIRVTKYPWEQEQQPKNSRQSGSDSKPSTPMTTVLSLSSSSKGSRRWSLKDFLLFRSASEGRASDKDPFKKYAALYRKQGDIKNSSHQMTESIGGMVVAASRRRGPVSAHEMHYTLNRAVSEDLKKKTFLPYKQGILGRVAINPAVHALANGFGSLTR
ncbi:hypothetical protein Nepgr_025066 [Nepenthes gracilis]|uniref:Uncharacterized protein n=1 Tax=Nepenthes gracilis TaxID=150966 RepID=A0AAD3T426_NEPGR|nr:hypothetical protein Nepgr_025066 [Nepenthes gracilis]